MNQWKRAVLEQIRVGIMAIDRNYRITYVNEGAASIDIYSSVVVGLSIFDVFENLKESESTLVRVIKTGESVHEKIQTFITSKGVRRTALTSTYPIIEDGQVVGAYEIFEDISAVTRLSDELTSLRTSKKKSEKPQMQTKEEKEHDFEIIGVSPGMNEVRNQIPKLAHTTSPILLYGETGTGKEVIVRAIAAASGGSLISQNCAAIPENLLESILFGTIKGSFTGAEDRQGLFEQANGGILFLDEINSLPLTLQSKLLRVIQEKKIRRLGDTKEIHGNFRLIAATNVHPAILLESGQMRPDLYYRLHVLYLELPALRHRKEDILPLVHHFISIFNEEFSKEVIGLEEDAVELLYNHHWPGNVRELKNWIERAMNHATGSKLSIQDLKPVSYVSIDTNPSMGISFTPLKQRVKEAEKQWIRQELTHVDGNISKAARRLDIPQQTMSRKIKEYGLQRYVYELKAKNTH